MAVVPKDLDDFFNYLFQADNGILKKYIADSVNVPPPPIVNSSRIRILEDRKIGPYHFNRHAASSRPNYITFLITDHENIIAAKIRIELPPQGQLLRVYDNLSNIEISNGGDPNIWCRKINKQWVFSKEYDRLEREKKEALMRNIEEIGFAPPSENGSFLGGGQYQQALLNWFQKANPRTPEQVAANLRAGPTYVGKDPLSGVGKDPLSGAYLPLTPIKKVKGGRRRTQRKHQRKQNRNLNRQQTPRSKSKSYSRRR